MCNAGECRWQGFFPKVEACYSWTWVDFHMTPHVHARAEIMYMMRGRCRIQIFEENQERELILGVGEFVFIDSGVAHALHVDEKCYMINVEFSFHQEPELISMQELMCFSPALTKWMKSVRSWQCGKDKDGMLHTALLTVIDDFSGLSEKDVALRKMHIGQMMIYLARALISHDTAGNGMMYVRRCIQLLSERLDEKIYIDELAGELGISAAYLQRIFRQVHGMTIIEYLNHLRIERAKLLLINTDEPIVDVAIETGFHSRQHFSRVFASVEGVSPKQFRLKNRKKESKQIFVST